MPYWANLDDQPEPDGVNQPFALSTEWRTAPAVLHGAGVTLRPLERSDASSLLSMLSTEEVTRFISPPPTTVEAYERFIAWTEHQKAQGKYLCFGIVPQGFEAAVGLIQVRALRDTFVVAEWGFALGFPFWGTGLFMESARAVVDFCINVVGVHRLEARASVSNGRGNGVLRKLGAIQEGTLRKSMYCRGRYRDQYMWAILDADWRRAHRPQHEWVH